MSRRILCLGLGLLAFVSVVTSCGIQTDSEPQVLNPNALPADLIGTEPPTPAPDAPEFVVFMVGPDEILTPVRRAVPFAVGFRDQARNVLESLFDGETDIERRSGIETAINRSVGVESIELADTGVAFLDLGAGSIVSGSVDDQELAFAQIVFTLTEFPLVDAVQVSIEGRFTRVPTPDGVSPPGVAVDRSSFSSLDPANRIGFLTDEEAVTGETPTSEPAPVLPTPIPALPGESGTPEPGSVSDEVDLVVWMIDAAGELVRRPRRLERTPEALLENLRLGPALGEPELGVRSAILTSAAEPSVDVDESAGIAFVDLAPNSLPPPGDDEKLRAVAQIVYTLTELSEIDAVSISIAGVRQALPTQDGITRAGAAVTRDDYLVLNPGTVGVPPRPIASPTPSLTPDPLATPGPDATSEADTARGAEASPTPSPSPATPTPTPTQEP